MPQGTMSHSPPRHLVSLQTKCSAPVCHKSGRKTEFLSYGAPYCRWRLHLALMTPSGIQGLVNSAIMLILCQLSLLLWVINSFVIGPAPLDPVSAFMKWWQASLLFCMVILLVVLLLLALYTAALSMEKFRCTRRLLIRAALIEPNTGDSG